MMRATEKRKTVIAATAITTLLSATAAFAAIKTAKKAGASNDDLQREANDEFTTVLNGLVKDGTITQAQEDAIQSAIKTAKEANTTNGDFTREENVEFTTVPSSSKTAMTRLKKTLFKEASKQVNSFSLS